MKSVNLKETLIAYIVKYSPELETDNDYHSLEMVEDSIKELDDANTYKLLVKFMATVGYQSGDLSYSEKSHQFNLDNIRKGLKL